MNKILIIILMISILSSGTNALCKDSCEKEMALTSAKKWLEVIDKVEYTKSWHDSGVIFKDFITPDSWKDSLSTVRRPLGKLIHRKIIKQIYYSSLQGMPDGNYFVIQFATKFENKENTIETITMVKEKDGKWRSLGYFMK